MAEGGGKARGVLSVNHSRNPPRQRQQSSCTATPRALMSQGSAVANGTDGQGPWHPGGGSCLINPQPQNRARGTGRCFALPCNLAKRAANGDQREKLCPPREPPQPPPGPSPSSRNAEEAQHSSESRILAIHSAMVT